MPTPPADQDSLHRYKLAWVVCGGGCLVLAAIGMADFLVFHALAELFAIVLVAVVGCAAHRFLRSGFLTLLAGNTARPASCLAHQRWIESPVTTGPGLVAGQA